MRSKTALLNLFIAVFAMSIPGIGAVDMFINILLAAYAGIFTVAFVYNNLPTNEHEQLSFIHAKLVAAAVFVLGSPIPLYAYLWGVLAPAGFNQILVLLILLAIFYIPLVIIAYVVFWAYLILLGID